MFPSTADDQLDGRTGGRRLIGRLRRLCHPRSHLEVTRPVAWQRPGWWASHPLRIPLVRVVCPGMINRAPWPALLFVLAVLAGCSGDDEPVTLPDASPTAPAESPSTESPTATPAPTPTVEPPAEPPNAHEYSEEGVEAFTRYAIDVINYAYQTNDVTPLEQIMTADCETCANTVENITDLSAQGSYVDGGQMVVEHVSPQQPTEGVRPGAVVDVVITASKTISRQGTTIESRSEERLQLVFFFSREGNLWKVDGIASGINEPS